MKWKLGLIEAVDPIGIKVNQEKTKYSVVSRDANDQADLQVDGYVFQ